MSHATRRALLTGALLAVASSWEALARADEPQVPVRLQVELLSKVVVYDRSFRRRAGGQALTSILVRKGDHDSERNGDELLRELLRRSTLGGLPHRVVKYEQANIAALIARIRAERPVILYITPGFSREVAEISRALATVDVLSVSAIAKYVDLGVVLGFGVRSGKPRLLVNLTQARKQRIDLSADLLRVADVIR